MFANPQKAKTAAAPSAAKKTTSGPSRKDRFKSTAQARKDIKKLYEGLEIMV